MSIIDFLFGRPLAYSEDRAEKIGALEGVPIFGLDALGSAAYGPEAALTLLIPLGLMGIGYIVPITAAIVILLGIVYFSYCQTIAEYPNGGGSYTVATENLGTLAGLVAGAALMIDYVLVVAVGIAAGVGALVSAVPGWEPYTLRLCLVILVAITIVNLRGTRDTGVAFMLPTYLFIVCVLSVLALGVWKTALSGGHPAAVVPPRDLGPAREAVTVWLLLKAFSSGCTAMTGVEAVSNGVMAFREPRTKLARGTLTIIIAILMLMLAGIGYLCRQYRVGATVPGQPGYESVLSQLTGAVVGKGWFYYLTIGVTLAVLALQANTAFADFPRLCRAIAQNGYLPRAFLNRGRRLVYSHGIYVLALLAAALIIVFGGITDRLIPLFAIGAFLAFTFSQAGMVGHWKRKGGQHAGHSMLINGLGATATAITVIVVAISKFAEGAWITLLLIPGIVRMMQSVRRHYDRVRREVASEAPFSTGNLRPPLVVAPVDDWNRITEKALRFALTLSPDVIAVHVDTGEQDGNNLCAKWAAYVEEPARAQGFPKPELVVLNSPYRYLIAPVLNYVLDLELKNPDRQIAVLIPMLVERRWYHRFLHNQHGELLTTMLLLKGNQRIVIVNVPWYLKA
jgi:amino acid transporter